MEELYRTLGDAKCKELDMKYDSLWKMLGLSGTRRSTQIGGAVPEGIAKDFIREFLPAGFEIKSGLVLDTQNKEMSPQIDGIVYLGVPLLEFSDVAVVEKEQAKAIVEVKSYIHTTSIFGEKSGVSRASESGLAYTFERRRRFLPSGSRYILFTFGLYSGYTDAKVIERLKEVCDLYAVILREEPKVERERGKER